MRSIHFGFMKILILTAITFLITTSCDVNDPKKDNPKPEGYQEDIPWPSLADSPWPRYHGNAQNNGRTKAVGPTRGVLAYTINIEGGTISSGIVIGEDSSIYFAVNPCYLYSLKKNGDLNWKLKVTDNEILNTPIIGKDGTIYVGLYQDKKFIAVNKEGTLKWEYQSSNPITEITANIGLDGTLYFVNQAGYLTALSPEGKFLWDLYINATKQITFSPDGKTLYVCTRRQSLIAVDLVTEQIKWEYNGYYTSSVSCDSHGNIYFIGIDKDYNGKLVCLNEDSEIRWRFDLDGWNDYGFGDILIDKLGNIYFASDTLYSLNFNGELKWKKNFDTGYFRHPLISDGQGTIYGILSCFDLHLEIMAIKNDGAIIWNIPVYGIESGLIDASGGIGYDNYWYIPFDDENSKLFIIQ